MKTRRIHYAFCLVAIAALMGAAGNVKGDCYTNFTEGRIVLLGGALGSQALDPANPLVIVAGGSLLEGWVSIHVENNRFSADPFPVCGTTSWGDHATSGWTIAAQHPTGEANYLVPISVTVPSEPGLHYIFIASAWNVSDCSSVLSCTGEPSPPGFDDGSDVADWNDDQAQMAIYLGWVCSSWWIPITFEEQPMPAAAIRVFVRPSECDPDYAGGAITVVSGTLGGQVLDPANPLVTTKRGSLLQGSVTIHVANNGGLGDVFPVCGTTSWGGHATSGWTITDHHPPGAANYTVPISVTVPSEPGIHYIFFAAAWELSCSNVLSCTNWTNPGGDVWNDGYDVADWTDDQAQNAMQFGWVCTKWLRGGSLGDTSIPAAAVEIFVPEYTAVESTSWGAIKEMYK